MGLGVQFEGLLAAARTGGEWALAALYRDLHPAVLRYLYSQDPGDAEDLASDAWLDVARGLQRFDGDETAFRRWVFTIARRRLLDHRRATARRRTDPVPAESMGYLEAPDCADEVMAFASTRAALARLASLPRDQAEVVLLRVLADLDVEDVAKIVGKRPGTVRVLQHRALKRLAGESGASRVTPRASEAM
jgi:RNA polymerase sigma-70 factor (ECF subfamily)